MVASIILDEENILQLHKITINYPILAVHRSRLVAVEAEAANDGPGIVALGHQEKNGRQGEHDTHSDCKKPAHGRQTI